MESLLNIPTNTTNGNGLYLNSSNSTSSTSEVASGTIRYGRYEFLRTQPELAIPAVIVLCAATLVGTFGSIMTVLVIMTKRNTKHVESIFMFNLVISDFYIILVADPMSIVAKIEGEDFFEQIPRLCQTVASICTVSCVTSLMTIGLLSVNRYCYICAHDKYERIFTKCNSICMCTSLYVFGAVLVLPNMVGIGDHGFDEKSIECIWDRMATYPYTVAFSITLVWTPAVVIGACYLRIYVYVRAHGRRMREINGAAKTKSFHLARTCFIIYLAFIACWAPYAVLIVVDANITIAKEIHMAIAIFAHLHPSVNWLIYYLTNKKFGDGFDQLLSRCGLSRSRAMTTNEIDIYNQTEISNHTTHGNGDATNNQLDIIPPENVESEDLK